MDDAAFDRFQRMLDAGQDSARQRALFAVHGFVRGHRGQRALPMTIIVPVAVIGSAMSVSNLSMLLIFIVFPDDDRSASGWRQMTTPKPGFLPVTAV